MNMSIEREMCYLEQRRYLRCTIIFKVYGRHAKNTKGVFGIPY